MSVDDVVLLLLTEFPYALFGSMAVGLVCGFLGVYIVARRVVFYGAVLTQVSVLGLAVTFLPALSLNHTVGSLILTVAVAVLLGRVLTVRNIPRDAVLGTVFVGAVSLRILILQKTPTGEASEIEGLLRGDILFVTPTLFYPLLAAVAVTMLIHLLFFKEFQYMTLDAETARTQGFRSTLWEILFYVLAAAVIAFATHVVGDLFVFGFMVVPPVTAMLLGRGVRQVFWMAAGIGAVVPAVGIAAAFLLDFPAAPASVAVALLLLAAAFLLRKLRGS